MTTSFRHILQSCVCNHALCDRHSGSSHHATYTKHGKSTSLWADFLHVSGPKTFLASCWYLHWCLVPVGSAVWTAPEKLEMRRRFEKGSAYSPVRCPSFQRSRQMDHSRSGKLGPHDESLPYYPRRSLGCRDGYTSRDICYGNIIRCRRRSAGNHWD